MTSDLSRQPSKKKPSNWNSSSSPDVTITSIYFSVRLICFALLKSGLGSIKRHYRNSNYYYHCHITIVLFKFIMRTCPGFNRKSCKNNTSSRFNKSKMLSCKKGKLEIKPCLELKPGCYLRIYTCIVINSVTQRCFVVVLTLSSCNWILIQQKELFSVRCRLWCHICVSF